MRQPRLLWPLFSLDLLLTVQGAFSLAEGQKFLSYVSRSIHKQPSNFTPSVCVICPCKGIDNGLEANLAALLDQDYPDYKVVFVIAQPDDPVRMTIERAIVGGPVPDKAKLIVAGLKPDRGEKINNLLSALATIDADRGVLVFADSDARPNRDWLRNLVQPLTTPGVGAATGYRWYVPVGGGFWSAMLSAWNGSVATTLGDHGRNFAWGGSTAITREVFNRAQIAEAWANAVSDDYALTRAIQNAGLKIVFVPRCLLASYESSSFRSLLEFTTRQVIITRVYRPAAWWVGMISHLLFVPGFFGQLGLITYTLAARFLSFAIHTGVLDVLKSSSWASSSHVLTMSIALGVIYVLGSLKGIQRLKAAMLALPSAKIGVLRCWWMLCLLWPLVSVLFLYNFSRSAMTRRIMWRGVLYELRSPSETVIIDR